MATASDAASAPAADTPSVAAVRTLLDAPVRITLSDQRVVIGKFSCFDKQRNVLLNEALEQRYADGDTTPSPPHAPEFERPLGLILVPRQHIVAVHAMSGDNYS